MRCSGSGRCAEAAIARVGAEAAGFALFFQSFSTFVGRPGLYLEDLYVRPAHRGRGIGRRLLAHLASIAVERDCGRFEWSVLDWNELAISSYRRAGAGSDGRVDRCTGLTGEPLRALAAEATRAVNRPETGDEQRVIAEQVAYYRARAPEYDDWFFRRGEYDHGAGVEPALAHGGRRPAAGARRRAAIRPGAGAGLRHRPLDRAAPRRTRPS